MFGALVGFELRRRLRMLSTYIYGAVLFLAGVFTMLASAGAFKDVAVVTGSERVNANSPYSIFGTTTVLALLGLFTLAAIFGQAAAQDFGQRTWMLIFSKNVRKRPYLLGRFTGAFAMGALLLLAVPVGQFAGAVIGEFIEPARVGPHRLLFYVWPYVVGVLPMLLLSGCVFFALAALTRQMAPVYVGAVVLVLGYMVLTTLLGNVDNQQHAALLDPFGLAAFELSTRYWTPLERNRDLIPLAGIFLTNRLIWGAVALGVLGVALARFRTTVAELPGTKRIEDEDGIPSIALPHVAVSPTRRSWLVTALSGSWLLFRTVLRSPVYWSFVVAGLLFTLIGILSSDTMFGTHTYPVTYRVLELAKGAFGLFFLITLTFYAGELVWQERDAGVSDIIDSCRVPTWVGFVSKVGALFLVAFSLQVVIASAGLTSQLSRGFFAIRPSVYAGELLLFGFFKGLPLCVLAITVQVLVNQKYLGHAVMVLYFVSQTILRAVGVEEPLLRFGWEPGIEYSDMNGYGHWIGAALLFRLFWYAVATLLLALSGALVVRGRETLLRTRLAQAKSRTTPLWIATVGVGALLAIGVGSALWYQTHVARPYLTDKDEERLRAEYEKTYRPWRTKPQPRIIAADIRYDLFPEESTPRYVVQGTYRLENKTQESVSQVLLSLPLDVRIRSLEIGAAKQPLSHDAKQGLFVFELQPPLAPQAQTDLRFQLELKADPLRHGNTRRDVVANGTFTNNSNLPMVGYQESLELAEDGVRRSYGLAHKERMADRDDAEARMHNYIRQDSDFIRFKATVSTVPDQIAVAPGYLKREWRENGRRYFEYEMDQPILNFFSVLSARYQVRRDEWNGVKLEIYFDPAHDYNLDRMMSGMKDALAYCSDAFGPYQHRQARILEFPRYARFAQSFPNTIPYSEAIGFIARVRDGNPDDLDYPYYVTAHEIAHQWWAHQVVGANVQGATLTSESMAQYSALMVMKKKYGREKMRRFLKFELDRYLSGRALERVKELPLGRNENQDYIHYQKGGLVMYALADFIGEDRVNRALKRYVEAVKYKGPPYTTAEELISYLREETPEELRYLLDDGFEKITLYDNRALSASVRPSGKGTWVVSAKVKAVKYQHDAKGEQIEQEFNDLLPVGALNAKGEALFVERRRVKQGETTLEFEVPEKPARVGLDPLNQLIDRNSEDNTIAL